MTMNVIPVFPGGSTVFIGSITTPQRVVLADDALFVSDRIILCQHVAPLLLTLPAAAPEETLIIVKDFDGTATTNNITIQTSGLDTIEGQPTYTLDVDFMSVMIGCDGAGRYFII